MGNFQDILKSWHEFYFMAGGAAATLIGLMFVAISLGTNLVARVSSENFKIYAAPSIVYFASVLLIACLMLIPDIIPASLAVGLGLGAVVGLYITMPRVVRLIQSARNARDFMLWDWLTQIIFPIVSYGLPIVSALCLLTERWSLSIFIIWVSTVLLLISAIANTWSMVLWIFEEQRDRAKS